MVLVARDHRRHLARHGAIAMWNYTRIEPGQYLVQWDPNIWKGSAESFGCPPSLTELGVVFRDNSGKKVLWTFDLEEGERFDTRDKASWAWAALEYWNPRITKLEAQLKTLWGGRTRQRADRRLTKEQAETIYDLLTKDLAIPKTGMRGNFVYNMTGDSPPFEWKTSGIGDKFWNDSYRFRASTYRDDSPRYNYIVARLNVKLMNLYNEWFPMPLHKEA